MGVAAFRESARHGWFEMWYFLLSASWATCHSTRIKGNHRGLQQECGPSFSIVAPILERPASTHKDEDVIRASTFRPKSYRLRSRDRYFLQKLFGHSA